MNDCSAEQTLRVKQACELFLNGDMDRCKAVLEVCIRADGGWERFSRDMGLSNWRTLRQMLQQSGNPTSKNLSAIIAQLRQRQRVQLRVGALPIP